MLILSGSPRREGNSDLLCDAFMRGAAESGNVVEKFASRIKKSAIAGRAITAASMRAHAPSRTIWRLCCKK